MEPTRERLFARVWAAAVVLGSRSPRTPALLANADGDIVLRAPAGRTTKSRRTNRKCLRRRRSRRHRHRATLNPLRDRPEVDLVPLGSCRIEYSPSATIRSLTSQPIPVNRPRQLTLAESHDLQGDEPPGVSLVPLPFTVLRHVPFTHLAWPLATMRILFQPSS